MNSRDKLFMWRRNHSSINACFHGSYLYSTCICVVWLLVYSASFIIWTLSYTICLFTVFNSIVLWMFAVFCFAWRSISVVLLATFMLVYLSITCNKLACTSVRSSVFSRKLIWVIVGQTLMRSRTIQPRSLTFSIFRVFPSFVCLFNLYSCVRIVQSRTQTNAVQVNNWDAVTSSASELLILKNKKSGIIKNLMLHYLWINQHMHYTPHTHTHIYKVVRRYGRWSGDRTCFVKWIYCRSWRRSCFFILLQ